MPVKYMLRNSSYKLGIGTPLRSVLLWVNHPTCHHMPINKIDLRFCLLQMNLYWWKQKRNKRWSKKCCDYCHREHIFLSMKTFSFRSNSGVFSWINIFIIQFDLKGKYDICNHENNNSDGYQFGDKVKFVTAGIQFPVNMVCVVWIVCMKSKNWTLAFNFYFKIETGDKSLNNCL